MCDTADKISMDGGGYRDGYSEFYGYWRINAYQALKAVKDDMEGVSQSSKIIESEVSANIPIPDGDLMGITSLMQISEDGLIDSIEEVSVDISHTYRGDLMVSLISPDDTVVPLYEGLGGGEDNLVEAYDSGTIAALKQLEGKDVRGKWQLKIVDRWLQDTGTLNKWGLKIKIRSRVI